MHRGPSAGERGRRPMSRQPAAKFNAGRLDRTQGVKGIPYAVDASTQTEFSRRPEEEFLELYASLAVPPVTNPDHVLVRLDLRQRPIQRGVRSFMPGERPVCPAEP